MCSVPLCLFLNKLITNDYPTHKIIFDDIDKLIKAPNIVGELITDMEAIGEEIINKISGRELVCNWIQSEPDRAIKNLKIQVKLKYLLQDIVSYYEKMIGT
jgi:hypothetical protein